MNRKVTPMESKAGLAAALDAVLLALLNETAASRTTLRLDSATHGVHVDDVIAEAKAPGVKSLRGQTSIDQRAQATVKWLERERRILVQNHLENVDPAPPAALKTVYETKAQMLAPLFREGVLQGWISVHYNPGPREWTAADQAALEKAARAAHAALDAAS
jgi:maleate isomerase